MIDQELRERATKIFPSASNFSIFNNELFVFEREGKAGIHATISLIIDGGKIDMERLVFKLKDGVEIISEAEIKIAVKKGLDLDQAMDDWLSTGRSKSQEADANIYCSIETGLLDAKYLDRVSQEFKDRCKWKF